MECYDRTTKIPRIYTSKKNNRQKVSGCLDYLTAKGVFWEPYLHVLRNMYVPGATRRERKRMAWVLRKYGLMDRAEYRSIKVLSGSLRHLFRADDILFYMDSRVFSFLVKEWASDTASENNVSISSTPPRSINITDVQWEAIHVLHFPSTPTHPVAAEAAKQKQSLPATG